MLRKIVLAFGVFTSFAVSAGPDSFTLTQDVSIKKPGGFLSSSPTITASAGKYAAVNTDEKGTYFNGPPFCWSATREDGLTIAANCGIFVPKSASEPYQLYYYPDSVKRLEDGKKGSEIAAELLGPGGALLVQAFDPDVAFEEGIEGFHEAVQAAKAE